MALREISNLLPGASVTGTSLLTSPRGAYPFPVKTPGAKSKSAKRQSLGGASLSHLYGGSGGGNDNRVLQLEAKLMCDEIMLDGFKDPVRLHEKGKEYDNRLPSHSRAKPHHSMRSWGQG